jgi:hypothetical protein
MFGPGEWGNRSGIGGDPSGSSLNSLMRRKLLASLACVVAVTPDTTGTAPESSEADPSAESPSTWLMTMLFMSWLNLLIS